MHAILTRHRLRSAAIFAYVCQSYCKNCLALILPVPKVYSFMLLLLPPMSEKKFRTPPSKGRRAQVEFLFCFYGATIIGQVCFKLHEKAKQKQESLETVYGNKNLVRTSTKDGKYSEGRESFAVDARSGRLSTARNSQTLQTSVNWSPKTTAWP